MEVTLTPMIVQYVVGLCCVRRNPDAVEIMLGDMVMDVAALKKRDVDVTVTLQEEDGSIRAFKAYEVKREGPPLDVTVAEQLILKLDDMPEVTHRGIVSSSGFSDGAINKAASHGVDLYALRPWTKSEGAKMPTFSGEPLPLQLASVVRLLLCWGKHDVYVNLARGPAEFTWEPKRELFSPSGAPHSKYATMGDLRDEVLVRSTDKLVAMKSVAEPVSSWPLASVSPEGEIEVTPLGHHTDTVELANEEICLRFGDVLAPVVSVSISGDLEWQKSAAEPDFRIMERVPDGEPFAGAALAPYGTPDGKLMALVFAPSSREVGIHTIQLLEGQRNMIRRLSLMATPEPPMST